MDSDAGDGVADNLALTRVESGARTSMPSGSTASWMARAQRMARAGPSNVARKPSPAVLTSRPRKRASSFRTMALCASEQVSGFPRAKGEFGIAPATAFEQYFPEVWGRSDGGTFIVVQPPVAGNP